MRLTNLGHAFWLLEAGGLRVAMDPILGERHTGGLFELWPRRRVEARSLRADFLFVSHVHFDHFDVESLHALAQADPDTVVVTPDPLVEEVCSLVGFRTVRRADPGTRIDLHGELALTLTPSRAPDVEWGVLAADRSGVAWNLVDTLLDGPADARRVRDLASPGRAVDALLAPLQSMREVALATAGHVGFRPAHHRHLLACAAAIEARHVIPSAAGDAHAPPFEAMNAWVYPVSAERAARDLAAFAPGVHMLSPRLGEALAIEGGDVAIVPCEGGGARTASGVHLHRAPHPAPDPRVFRPLDPAPLVDPNLAGADVGALRDRCVHFARAELAPAVARALSATDPLRRLRYVLEVVLPGDRLAFTIDARGHVEDRFDPEYDVLDAIAASLLVDVLDGRRAWYEPLLAGALRSSVRGSLVTPSRAPPLPLGPILLYEALPYRLSTERAARWRAHQALSRASAASK